jgi:hypothetical protein
MALESRSVVIQGIYRGVEIEIEMYQLMQGGWRCDYTLIKHRERTKTIYHGDREFRTMELAREYALDGARIAIDHSKLS